MSETIATVPEPQPDEKAARIVADILRAAHRLRAVLVSHFAEFGLTDVRYAVLQVVRDAGSQGCSQTELAMQIDQSESSVSTLVDRMRSGGLLYRLRSKSDRRKRVLMLTDSARDVLQRIDNVHSLRTATLLSRFSPAELDFFSKLVCRLVADLSDLQATFKSPAELPLNTQVVDHRHEPVEPSQQQAPAA